MPRRFITPPLTRRAIAGARPKASEYTLWDSALAHFGVRVHPSGVRAFIVQTRVRGRMRKLTLGRFPDMSLADARTEAATTLARIWSGKLQARPARIPRFAEFAVRYRERCKARWKPATLKTYDTYLRARLLPAFGRLRLDRISHARIAAWFDAASAERPGAANRAFEILRAMLRTAREWGDLARDHPDACAHLVLNPKRPVARYLSRDEFRRLGAALEQRQAEHPWPVAAVRLLTLTGARVSEILQLRRDAVLDLDPDGGAIRLADSKTGPRTLWLGAEAARLLAALPAHDDGRVFPRDLTAARLSAFWVQVREAAGLHGTRLHDARHSYASQGVMHGVGLTTVGHLLGHRRPTTTAIYAHLDDATLLAAAARTADVIARAMRYPPVPPS